MLSTGVRGVFRVGFPVLLTLFVISGCKTVGPDFEKPDVPVADTWLDAENEHVDSSSANYQDWWGVFQDPTLTKLIDTAYQQNLSLQVAGLRVMESRAQLGIATGLKYPQSQSVGGGYAYSRSSINAPPLSNLPDNVLQNVDRTASVWSASFDAGWEADVWGKFRRGVEAADANLAASMLNYDAVLVTLTGDVAALYTSIRTLQERLDFAYSNVKLQQQALKLANSQFEFGATSELDVQQAKGLLYNTESLIPLLTLNLERAQNTLSFLLGMPPSNLETMLGTSRKIPTAPSTVAVGIPADLLRRRPDVRAAELALVQYRQGAADYTRVLNTQTALLLQQDELTAVRGQVVSNLVATYKALGGGWQLREGNNFVSPDLINSMEIRTDWGDLLMTPEQAEKSN